MKKFEELSSEQREMYEGWAKKINDTGLAPLAKFIINGLDNGFLIVKNGKVMISGEWLFDMKQTYGGPPELYRDTINDYIKTLIPNEAGFNSEIRE